MTSMNRCGHGFNKYHNLIDKLSDNDIQNIFLEKIDNNKSRDKTHTEKTTTHSKMPPSKSCIFTIWHLLKKASLKN